MLKLLKRLVPELVRGLPAKQDHGGSNPPEASTYPEMVRKIRSQRDEIRRLNECLRIKNIELDALHYVWCTGGCKTGQHRWCSGVVTEDEMALAERNVLRLRTRYDNTVFKTLTKEQQAAWFASGQRDFLKWYSAQRR